MNIDFIFGALFTLALFGAACGGFMIRGRWTRRDADRPMEGPDAWNAGPKSVPVPPPEQPEQTRQPEPPAQPEPLSEDAVRRRKRARAEQDAFLEVLHYSERTAYGIEPDFPGTGNRAGG